MKKLSSFLAVVICLAVVFSSLPITSLAANGDKINVPPKYPQKAYVEISKMGMLSTYGEKYEDLAEQVYLDFSFEPLDLSGVEQIEFDIFIADYSKFKSAFSSKIFSFNLSTNATDKLTDRLTFTIYDQIKETGWNHIVISLKNSMADLSKVTFVYIHSNGGSVSNPVANTQLKVANICGISGVSLYFIPSVTVGKDETEMIVTWLQGNNSDSKVILNENGTKTEFTAINRTTNTKYYSSYATVTNLKPNTNYTYYIESGTFKSNEYPLSTKDFDDSFSFVHISDIQITGASELSSRWENTLSAINENLPDTSFIVNTGDVSDSSADNNCYLVYKTPELTKSYIMGVVPGNHDSSSSSESAYYTLHFTSPETYESCTGFARNGYDYWYGYNNVLFISLNTLISDMTYHKNFVKKVIKEQGDNYDWTIVTGHHSFFSASYHSTESRTVNLRDALAPLFSELGVDLVLSGHDHVYDRSYMMDSKTPKQSNKDYAFDNGSDVLYISGTTGSGMKYNEAVDTCWDYSAKVIENKYGFINYEVCEDAITMTFYNTDNMSILDKFTLYKQDDDHKVVKEESFVDEFIQNENFDSNGIYEIELDTAKDVSNTCSVEFDILNKSETDNISIVLKDAEGDYIQKTFEGLDTGWNHLVIEINDTQKVGDVNLQKITSVELIGNPYDTLTVSNGYAGHQFDNSCDASCNSCGEKRTVSHTYKSTTAKATLDSDGRVERKCIGCGYIASSSYDVPKISSVKLSATSYTYNGATRTPTVTVKDSAGKTLKKDTDYTVSYASGRKNAGTYKVTVTFKGNYSGSKVLSFKINPIKVTSKFKFSLSATSYTYNGKVKSPSVTVKNDSGSKLTKNTHYTVTYASGRKNVGTYKVTIKMKGNYSGTKTLYFKINPVKTTVSKLSAAKKSIKVSIAKKSTQVTGYQIYYSTSKTFKSYKSTYVTSYKTTSKTLSKLSAKKTYYVKVRTYKTVNGTKYYSGWSTVKSIKTK